MITKDLIAAYKSTAYCIDDPQIVIQIDQHNPELDKLLDAHQSCSWCFITAHNPHSELLSGTLNQQNNRHLKLWLEVRQKLYFPGSSHAQENNWPIEHGFLVFNISQNEIIELATMFDQNGVVYGELNKRAQLLLF